MNIIRSFKKQLISWWNKLKYKFALLPFQPKLFWYRLWIRKDEFHVSLHLDPILMIKMDSQDTYFYLMDIYKRRKIAHERGMNRHGN